MVHPGPSGGGSAAVFLPDGRFREVMTRPPTAGSGTAPECSDLHGAMARLAVDLLSGPSGDLAGGAETARQRRLAGLFLHGVATRGNPDEQLARPVVEALRRASSAEAFDDAVSAGEIGD